jgi:hypothetical protein
MSTSERLNALHEADPRNADGFADSVEAVAAAVRARIAAEAEAGLRPRRRRSFRLVAVCASTAAVAAAVAIVTLGLPGGGTGVENATAAVEQAATVTAAAAERSGTATVRITHDGRLWAGSTIRWHSNDLAVSSDAPRRPGKLGRELLVVNGTMYGIEDGGWVVLGPPESVDPDSGTTPDEYLAAVREDVGGATLRRIMGAISGLTERDLSDGSTVYSGTVPAGQIARETGFKEGQSLRVLPFGYVAHDEADNPAAPLDVAVTVGPGGAVSEIAVSWGTWRYTVAYDRLGATHALAAPKNARPLRRTR